MVFTYIFLLANLFFIDLFIGLHLHGFPRDGYEGDDYDHDGVDGCGDICTYKNAFKGMCLLAWNTQGFNFSI